MAAALVPPCEKLADKPTKDFHNGLLQTVRFRTEFAGTALWTVQLVSFRLLTGSTGLGLDRDMDQAAQDTTNNRFLQALPSAVYRRVRSSLQPITLRHGDILGHIGAPFSDLYFLDFGLISLLKVMNDGRTAEIAVAGREGMIAITALMGIAEADSIEMTVQLDGSGHRLPLRLLKSEMDRSMEVQSLAMRYLQFTMNRMAQTAACNALHRISQRCCRWLLEANDNAEARTFGLTHEFLAMMMGVHRPGLSVVLESLQQRRLIETHRGSITILDRLGLEASACECYAAIRKDLENLYRPG